MNRQIQNWFSKGKAVDALCGFGAFFEPNITYRERHSYGFILRELLEWAEQGHDDEAAQALTMALEKLLSLRLLDEALLLLRAYQVVKEQKSLPLDEKHLAEIFARSAADAAPYLAQNEELRILLLMVCYHFPALREALGLSEAEVQSTLQPIFERDDWSRR